MDNNTHLGDQLFTAVCSAFGAACVVLGIPLLAFIAGLIGAGGGVVISPRVPDEKIPVRMVGIIVIAFIAGWLAVGIVTIAASAKPGWGVHLIPIEAIAGLLALFWHVIKPWLGKKVDALVDGLIAKWTGRRPGGA